jgi:hypothetical protein
VCVNSFSAASDGRPEGEINQRPQGSRTFHWRGWQGRAA